MSASTKVFGEEFKSIDSSANSSLENKRSLEDFTSGSALFGGDQAGKPSSGSSSSAVHFEVKLEEFKSHDIPSPASTDHSTVHGINWSIAAQEVSLRETCIRLMNRYPDAAVEFPSIHSRKDANEAEVENPYMIYPSTPGQSLALETIRMSEVAIYPEITLKKGLALAYYALHELKTEDDDEEQYHYHQAREKLMDVLGSIGKRHKEPKSLNCKTALIALLSVVNHIHPDVKIFTDASSLSDLIQPYVSERMKNTLTNQNVKYTLNLKNHTILDLLKEDISTFLAEKLGELWTKSDPEEMAENEELLEELIQKDLDVHFAPDIAKLLSVLTASADDRPNLINIFNQEALLNQFSMVSQDVFIEEQNKINGQRDLKSLLDFSKNRKAELKPFVLQAMKMGLIKYEHNVSELKTEEAISDLMVELRPFVEYVLTQKFKLVWSLYISKDELLDELMTISSVSEIYQATVKLIEPYAKLYLTPDFITQLLEEKDGTPQDLLRDLREQALEEIVSDKLGDEIVKDFLAFPYAFEGVNYLVKNVIAEIITRESIFTVQNEVNVQLNPKLNMTQINNIEKYYTDFAIGYIKLNISRCFKVSQDITVRAGNFDEIVSAPLSRLIEVSSLDKEMKKRFGLIWTWYSRREEVQTQMISPEVINRAKAETITAVLKDFSPTLKEHLANMVYSAVYWNQGPFYNDVADEKAESDAPYSVRMHPRFRTYAAEFFTNSASGDFWKTDPAGTILNDFLDKTIDTLYILSCQNQAQQNVETLKKIYQLDYDKKFEKPIMTAVLKLLINECQNEIEKIKSASTAEEKSSIPSDLAGFSYKTFFLQVLFKFFEIAKRKKIRHPESFKSALNDLIALSKIEMDLTSAATTVSRPVREEVLAIIGRGYCDIDLELKDYSKPLSAGANCLARATSLLQNAAIFQSSHFLADTSYVSDFKKITENTHQESNELVRQLERAVDVFRDYALQNKGGFAILHQLRHYDRKDTGYAVTIADELDKLILETKKLDPADPQKVIQAAKDIIMQTMRGMIDSGLIKENFIDYPFARCSAYVMEYVFSIEKARDALDICTLRLPVKM